MMTPSLSFFATLLVGYALSLYISRPIERDGQLLTNRLPSLRLGNIEILPNLRIHIGNRTYWLHHWLYLTIFTIGMFLAYDNMSHLLAVKGVAIGSIIQGLRYPDRFKFRHPRRK